MNNSKIDLHILDVDIGEYVYNLFNNRWEKIINKTGKIDNLSLEYTTVYKNYLNSYDLYGRLYYRSIAYNNININIEDFRLKCPAIYKDVIEIAYSIFDIVPVNPKLV